MAAGDLTPLVCSIRFFIIFYILFILNFPTCSVLGVINDLNVDYSLFFWSGVTFPLVTLYKIFHLRGLVLLSIPAVSVEILHKPGIIVVGL